MKTKRQRYHASRKASEEKKEKQENQTLIENDQDEGTDDKDNEPQP